MKTIPDLPPAFALPQEFRQSLPADVQEWLDHVEKRIDGMTLVRIEAEADKLAGEDNPEAERLYRLGRRLFYVRCQQIVDIMFPGEGIEFGIDLLWQQDCSEIPGGAVTDALTDGEGINEALKRAGVAGCRGEFE